MEDVKGDEGATAAGKLLVSVGLVTLEDVIDKPSLVGSVLLSISRAVGVLCSLDVDDSVGEVGFSSFMPVVGIVNVVSVDDSPADVVVDGSRCSAVVLF